MRLSPALLAPVLLALAPCGALADSTDGTSALAWTRIEELEKAGELDAALELLEGLAPTPGEALRVAATRVRLLHRSRDYRAARTAGEAWIELAEAASDERELVTALWRTGRSLAALYDFDSEAETYFARALEVGEGLDDAVLLADIRVDRANVLRSVGRYREAQEMLEAARADVESSPDDRLAARVFGAWGSLLERVGDPVGALDRREHALAAARRAEDRVLIHVQLINVAQTLVSLHDYAGALERLGEAVALEPDPSRHIITLVTTGICHIELNQLEAAERALRQARDLAAEVGLASLEGWAVGELGLVAAARGDDELAMGLFDQAIESNRRIEDPRGEMVWWTNKGRVRRDQERWTEALAFYREAEEIERSTPGQRPHPNLRKHIGQTLAGLGRDEEAEAQFLSALELAAEAGDTKVQWETQRALARLYRRTGRTAQAHAAYLAALDGIESIRGAQRLESLEANFFEDKVEVYVEAIEALLEDNADDAPARTFEIAERARARAFLGSLAEARAGLDETLPPALVERERWLLLEISQLEAALRRGEAVPETRAALREREGELETLLLTTRAARPRFAELRHLEPVPVASIRDSLAPGESLAAYLLADGGSHLWLIDRDGLSHRRLPPAAELEPRIRRAYTDLLSPTSTPDLEELAAALLAPIGDADAAPSSLVIVPWGILHYLPFDVLPLGAGLVADRVSTSYVPSASALVELRRRPVVPPTPRCLALGDADYEGVAAPDRAGEGAALGGFAALPQTRREVEILRSRFGRGSVTALLGGEATESRLKDETLAEYSVLHLATHGWIDSHSPARNGLVLGPGREGEDGVLSFREILRLRLAADLVTLSACETALGDLVTGEGMVGLARAFFYAGSDSVVASLWNVSDEASAELMERFYAGLAAGLPKAESLRRARLAVRSDPRFAHPYYWAPFGLLGRGEDGIELPPRRGIWLGLGLAVGGAAVFVLLTLRRRASRVSG
jgi:CHAT domain-containing protein